MDKWKLRRQTVNRAVHWASLKAFLFFKSFGQDSTWSVVYGQDCRWDQGMPDGIYREHGQCTHLFQLKIRGTHFNDPMGQAYGILRHFVIRCVQRREGDLASYKSIGLGVRKTSGHTTHLWVLGVALSVKWWSGTFRGGFHLSLELWGFTEVAQRWGEQSRGDGKAPLHTPLPISGPPSPAI